MWQPAAELAALKQRAQMLASIRAFFAARDVWEVDTPVLSVAATTDPHIHSFAIPLVDSGAGEGWRYLHTSPEFAMKRLLAAGSGSIYQIAKVFRAGERGRRHNAEFTLLEWYRLGFEHHQLMDEVEALVTELLTTKLVLQDSIRVSYQALFQDYLIIDPLTAGKDELADCARRQGIAVEGIETESTLTVDDWLNVLLSHCIEPQLDVNRLIFIYDYPASQAALAKIRSEPQTPPVAERFELFLNGMELANGFHELNDAEQQRRRFSNDNQQRHRLGLAEMPVDEHLLAALTNLPDCAGVALGLDRLLMLAVGATDIADVIAFPWARA